MAGAARPQSALTASGADDIVDPIWHLLGRGLERAAKAYDRHRRGSMSSEERADEERAQREARQQGIAQEEEALADAGRLAVAVLIVGVVGGGLYATEAVTEAVICISFAVWLLVTTMLLPPQGASGAGALIGLVNAVGVLGCLLGFLFSDVSKHPTVLFPIAVFVIASASKGKRT